MTQDTERPQRRSIRLRGYDYGLAGAYFFTIVTKDRACLFGDVVGSAMCPNEFGKIIQSVWAGLPDHYSNVANDAFIVMPNHVHGIIMLAEKSALGGSDVGAGLKPAREAVGGSNSDRAGLKPAPTLPEILRAFKTFSARRINEIRSFPGVPVWQRNYYEHVVRGENELNRIREYIANNPLQWELDRENPLRRKIESTTKQESWEV